MAEALHDRGLAVTVVEKAPHVLPPVDPELAVDIERELAATRCRWSPAAVWPGCKRCRTSPCGSPGERPGAFRRRGAPVDRGQAEHGAGGRGRTADWPDGAIGGEPIQQTNDPDIYAVGDVAEVVHGVTGKPVRVRWRVRRTGTAGWPVNMPHRAQRCPRRRHGHIHCPGLFPGRRHDGSG